MSHVEEHTTGLEILHDKEESVELAKNKLDGPWRTRKKYLGTHYELPREDAISHLPDGVAQLRKTPHMSDDSEIAVYDKVYVAGVTFATQGLAARLQF